MQPQPTHHNYSQQPGYPQQQPGGGGAFQHPQGGGGGAPQDYQQQQPAYQQQPQYPTTSTQQQQPGSSHQYPPTAAPQPVAPVYQGPPVPQAPLTTDHNGLRWTWSSFPTTTKVAKGRVGMQAFEKVVGQVAGNAEAGDVHHHIPLPTDMVVPLAAVYTPLYRDTTAITDATNETSSQRIVYTGEASSRCTNCGTYLSKAAHVDTSFWACPSCQHRMALPQGFVPGAHPSMLADTVEYILPASNSQNGSSSFSSPSSTAIPVFTFIVDVAVTYDELEALKRELLATLDKLPPNAHVGLISYGRNVTVWDLACSDLNRCYSIRGNRPYVPSGGQTTAAMNLITSALNTVGAGGSSSPSSPALGTGMGGSNAGKLFSAVTPDSPSSLYLRSCLMIHSNSPSLGRFLCPLEDCEFVLTSIIEELSVDPFPVPTGFRSERATGTALDTAVTLMETVSVDVNAKVLLFAGGPATRGPGAVVSMKKEEMLRSHRDFQSGDCPHYDKAVQFYTDVEKRLCAAGASLDVFVASFDQIGIMELRSCVNHTGGNFICVDTFADIMFSESLSRYFALRDFSGSVANGALERIQEADPSAAYGPSLCGYNAQLSVYTSRDTLVSGVVGPCRAIAPPSGSTPASPADKHDRPTTNISSVEVGQGGTQSWRLSCLDPNLTLTFIFDTATLDEAPTSAGVSHRKRFCQFVTTYTTVSGERRVRVTSISHHVSPSTEPTFYVNNSCFDQTCAATVVARMAVSTMEDYSPMSWDSTKRWLDKMLVTFVRRFGTYQVGRPESLRLSPTMSLFPSFMYNLRRSEYFMQMNISPDETVFKRHWLMREPCDACVMMIQPTLHSYTLADPRATPVPLDSNSILPDNILVIDCFFNLHVIWGQVVYEWKKLGYHENPEYAHFAALLEAPTQDTKNLLARRYPYPRFSETDINGGESRHLKTRLNPSATYHDKQPSNGQPGGAPQGGAGGGAYLNTDDASVAKFMATLKEAVVRQDTTKGTSALGH